MAPDQSHGSLARGAAMLHESVEDLGAEVLRREPGGAVRVPEALLRRARLSDRAAIRVQVQPGRLVSESLASVTDELAGSAPDLWGEEVALEAGRVRRRYGVCLPDALHLASARAAGAAVYLTNDRCVERASEYLPVMVLDDLAAVWEG